MGSPRKAGGCPILERSRSSCVPGGLFHGEHSPRAGRPEPELGGSMADRRTLLVAALVTLGLLLAACGLAGPMLDSASLSRKLGEHGYVNANVTVAFNAS